MRLSTRARYALHCMLAIAHETEATGQPLSLERVAHDTDLSKRYLEQLAMALKNASLVTAVSGRHGGYLLARPAPEISLRHIFEAVIGPINIVKCVLEPPVCPKNADCRTRLLHVLMTSRINELLESFTLADMGSSEWADIVTDALGDRATMADGVLELREADAMPS